MFGTIGTSELVILAAILWVIPLWQILKKSGRSGAWSLVSLFAPAGLVLLYVIAFSEWPVHRELKKLKATAPSA